MSLTENNKKMCLEFLWTFTQAMDATQIPLDRIYLVTRFIEVPQALNKEKNGQV